MLGNGWPGILLHEAIGHDLEGDFNRKKTSAFAGLLGQRIAATGITVVDDGTIPDRRGSLTVDDEGTPSGRMVMIEDGILKGFISSTTVAAMREGAEQIAGSKKEVMVADVEQLLAETGWLPSILRVSEASYPVTLATPSLTIPTMPIAAE